MTTFGTVRLEYATSVETASDGDLWPACWADDGHLYLANGDGAGFGEGEWSDIVVSRVTGDPRSGITGERLAAGRDVSPIWGDPARFNCKPTGIVAVDGDGDGRDELYLAVQDLAYGEEEGAFDNAPSASVMRSLDYGATWQATSKPMFENHVFTTVMFLDFGQSNQRERELGLTDDAYVYAYGLDGNWRTSYSAVVDDPTDLYLARVPASRVVEREGWEFFVGLDDAGQPLWSPSIDRRRPVLTDARRLYLDRGPGDRGHTTIAQGGVVYNHGLGAFLYTSWTEFTFQFYSAPRPWGPWKHFHEVDFGPYPWVGPKAAEPRHGGYATTIPSKFISEDGREMWLQSNWFWRSSAYTGNTYRFSLRRLAIEPLSNEAAVNAPGDKNLARAPDAVPICAVAACGHPDVLVDGDRHRAEDSWNGTRKASDFWGVTWPRRVRLDTVVCTWGPPDYVAGWFDPAPMVEVRCNGRWTAIDGLELDPPYTCDASMTGFRTTTFRFSPTEADGVRVVGVPAGTEAYTSISELEVFLAGSATPL
jgi:hypothetical protein